MVLLFYYMSYTSSITLGVIENTLRVIRITLGLIIPRVFCPTSAVPREDGP